jgi:hypothetical protein
VDADLTAADGPGPVTGGNAGGHGEGASSGHPVGLGSTDLPARVLPSGLQRRWGPWSATRAKMGGRGGRWCVLVAEDGDTMEASGEDAGGLLAG